jgi:hypothetical protein
MANPWNVSALGRACIYRGDIAEAGVEQVPIQDQLASASGA